MSRSELSHFFSGNTAFIEDVYDRYLENPASVTVEWRRYFDDPATGIRTGRWHRQRAG